MAFKLTSTLAKAHAGPINATQFDQSGEYVFTAGSDKCIRLWNRVTSNLIKSFTGHGWEILTLAIAKDNEKFASGGGDRSVFFWDISMAQTIRRLSGHSQRVNAVAFNASGSVLASGSFDATVRLWDLKSNNRSPIQVLTEAKDSVTSIEIREHLLLTGSADGRLRTYDLRMRRVTTDVVAAPITSATFSGDCNCILASTLDSTIRLFDVASGELLNSYSGHRNQEYSLKSAVDFTDSFVASGDEQGKVFLWDYVEAESKPPEILTHSTARIPIHCVLWHPSVENTLLTAGADGCVKVWTGSE